MGARCLKREHSSCRVLSRSGIPAALTRTKARNSTGKTRRSSHLNGVPNISRLRNLRNTSSYQKQNPEQKDLENQTGHFSTSQ